MKSLFDLTCQGSNKIRKILYVCIQFERAAIPSPIIPVYKFINEFKAIKLGAEGWWIRQDNVMYINNFAPVILFIFTFCVLHLSGAHYKIFLFPLSYQKATKNNQKAHPSYTILEGKQLTEYCAMNLIPLIWIEFCTK